MSGQSNKNIFGGLIVGVLVVIILVGYWHFSRQKPSVEMSSEKKSGLVVINVLDKPLYDDCHIKGSINVPFTDLETFVSNLDKEKSEIVVYCSNYMCSSSGHGAKTLKKLGYKNVWAYEGGTAEWHQLGLPVEGQCTQAYLQKKLEPSEHDPEIPVISAQELAQKMGVAA